MGNCLVTKLKAVVQNDNLIGLGKGYFYVDATSMNAVVYFTAYHNPVFKVTNDDGTGFTTSNNTSIPKNDNTFTVVTSGDTVRDTLIDTPAYVTFTQGKRYIVEYDKYNAVARSIQDSVVVYNDTEYLKWKKPIIPLSINTYATSYEGDLEELLKVAPSNSEALVIAKGNTNTKGSIECLSNYLPSLRILLQITFCNGITGNIESLAQHPNAANIRNIDFTRSESLSGNLVTALGPMVSLVNFTGEGNSRFTGNISDIATAQAENRNSGSLTIKGYMPGVSPNPSWPGKKINFGSSMVNPTAEESAQGWQIVDAS